MKNILHLPERVILKTKDKCRNLNIFAAINPKPATPNLFQGTPRCKTKIESITAFSLVEMLMALLVASLLMAALAPVMTKKMHENLVITGTGGAVIPTSSCDYTTPGTFGQNGECTVPSNIYEAGFIIASGGGGGGASADMTNTSVVKVDSVDAASSSSGSQTSKIYEFTNTTKTLRFLMSGGGGGAGGAYYSALKMDRPESQADCRDKDGNNFGQYISSEQNGGNGAICVALYHPGEGRVGSPDIPDTVKKCTAGATSGQTGYCGNEQECITNGNCCWQGATTNSGACDANGYSVSGVFSNTYGGCNRSSCQYSAADKICSNWKPLGSNGGTGRLPTKSEASAWANNIKYITSPPRTGVLNRNTGYDHPGLQLCEYLESSKYGAAQCYYSNNRCAGSGTSPGLYVNHCHVMVFWLSDKTNAGEGYHWFASLKSGLLGNNSSYKTTAYSARCVIDEVYTFESYAGGGGSAGAYLSVDIPPEVLEKATENGGKAKAVLKAGAGGNAGTTASGSSAGGRGINGMSSSVEIYSDNSELIYSIEVPGGIGGYGANSTDAGNPADILSADDNNCKYFNKITGTGDEKISPVNVKCSKITSSYNMGNVAPTKASGADTSSTGGKNTGWGTSSLISSGGGGGFCTYEERNLTCPDVTQTGKGTGGRIDIYASTSHPGAGGGGGAAGSLVTFRSSKLIPGDKIVSTVGKGGNAGADGEDSSVKIYRDDVLLYKLTVKGGGKGQNAIQAVIASNTPAKGGSGGVASGLNTAETSPARMLWTKNYKIYPENPEDTKGKDGISPQIWGVWNDKMAGGNGGVNSKISSEVGVDAGISQGNPCGGLSTEAVKINDTTEWACENSTSIAPFALTRAILEDFRYTFVDTPPGGSTGGGGGGWMYHADGSPNVSNGAKGLDGYIYIYYGEWGKENTSQ